MGQTTKIFRSFIKVFIGFLIFIMLLIFANILGFILENNQYHAALKILNDNLILLVIIGLLFLVADLFWLFNYPLNLPAPVFGSLGAVFLISFLYKLFGLLDIFIVKEELFSIPREYLGFIYTLAFLAVLMSGYILIFIKRPEIDKQRRSVSRR